MLPKYRESVVQESSDGDAEIEDDSDEEDGKAGDDDEDDDTETPADSEYIRRLQREARTMFGLDDDSDPDDEFTDDEDVDTPINPIDPFKAFAETMGNLERTNAGRVQLLMSRLDQGSQDAIKGMVEYAAKRKQEEPNGVPNGHQ